MRSERVMAELFMVDRWMRFRPLYRGRCLGYLIICYFGHTPVVIEAHKVEEGAIQM